MSQSESNEARVAGQEIQWRRSKVDWWLALALTAPPIGAVAVFAAALTSGEPLAWLWGVGSPAFVALLYLGLLLPVRYGMDDVHLHVQSGQLRQRIPLTEIVEVSPTRNPLSSPALSLDRLQVKFGARMFRSVMISPVDRDGFLEELARRAGMTRTRGRLFR